MPITIRRKTLKDILQTVSSFDGVQCPCGDLLASFSDILTHVEQGDFDSYTFNCPNCDHDIAKEEPTFLQAFRQGATCPNGEHTFVIRVAVEEDDNSKLIGVTTGDKRDNSLVEAVTVSLGANAVFCVRCNRTLAALYPGRTS